MKCWLHTITDTFIFSCNNCNQILVWQLERSVLYVTVLILSHFFMKTKGRYMYNFSVVQTGSFLCPFKCYLLKFLTITLLGNIVQESQCWKPAHKIDAYSKKQWVVFFLSIWGVFSNVVVKTYWECAYIPFLFEHATILQQTIWVEILWWIL